MHDCSPTTIAHPDSPNTRHGRQRITATTATLHRQSGRPRHSLRPLSDPAALYLDPNPGVGTRRALLLLGSRARPDRPNTVGRTEPSTEFGSYGRTPESGNGKHSPNISTRQHKHRTANTPNPVACTWTHARATRPYALSRDAGRVIYGETGETSNDPKSRIDCWRGRFAHSDRMPNLLFTVFASSKQR